MTRANMEISTAEKKKKTPDGLTVARALQLKQFYFHKTWYSYLRAGIISNILFVTTLYSYIGI